MERVRVEEPGAVERGRGRDDVVQRALGEVGVARVAGGEQQAPGEHHRRDAGARLRVRAVRRQLVVLAERLVAVPRAHAAGQVRAPRDRPLPLALDRGQQLVVAGLDRDVDRRARQVERAHGVPAERLARRGSACRPGSTRGRARCPPAPAARAARRTAAPARGSAPRPVARYSSTSAISISGCPQTPWLPSGPNASQTWSAARAGDLDQPVLAARAQARDRGLDQVAVAVQLVAPLEVGVALLRRRGGRSGC